VDEERKRLMENSSKSMYWKKWGPYLSERQWGTVREDYSVNGDAWNYLNFWDSHKRAYRFGEDGIAGICDTHEIICLSHTFWNEKDPILKEKMFGLSNQEGNHGEDIKEIFYYLDNTPTHSYMKYVYKYPISLFPYEELISKNRERSQNEKEFEITDTEAFSNHNYFNLQIEYAKASPYDIYLYLRVKNMGKNRAKIHLLPTVFFRNTWKWDKEDKKPLASIFKQDESLTSIKCSSNIYKDYFLIGPSPFEVLFTENESRDEVDPEKRISQSFAKDAFHHYLVNNSVLEVNPQKVGTKAAFHYILDLEGNQEREMVLRFCREDEYTHSLIEGKKVLQNRKNECDQFFESLYPKKLNEEEKKILKQAFSGLLWSKQFYHYPVKRWLDGEAALGNSGFERISSRNKDWMHLYNEDILSMPDKWEYPWFAAWDLAFHTVALSRIDPEFAKKQLMVVTREWFMHPNGQIPAYEWNFADVNPPVHAWATWRVYKIDKKQTNQPDMKFLESMFHKLLLNFTWWVNREDEEGRNIFKGGFLGLDNISVFNRSEDLPKGSMLYQSDATSWMGMFAAYMLLIAIELSKYNPSYEDMASKFLNHFLYISKSVNHPLDHMPSLWCEEEGFYYDVLKLRDGTFIPLKVKSLVGLLPLLASMTIEEEDLNRMKDFSRRLTWFVEHRKDLWEKMASFKEIGSQNRRLLSIVSVDRLKKILKVLLDENEFLSPFGIRSLSKYHKEHPFSLAVDGVCYSVGYEPSESRSRLFGGNSNWRGPIWMPVNILLIEALQKFHHYLGEEFKVEFPTGSNHFFTLWEISLQISERLKKIFMKDSALNRPLFGSSPFFKENKEFTEDLLFFEYFDAETGEGLGASHQTGWTAMIAKILLQLGKYRK